MLSARIPLVLLLSVVFAAGCVTSRRRVTDAEPPPDVAVLTRIGDEVTHAILTHDLEVLLRYARPDLVQTPNLEPMRRELEAYLFEDVYRVLSSSRPLRTWVRNLGTEDGTHWAQLVFYDGAAIREDALRHPRFLCEHDLTDAVAWTFRRVNGRWQGMGYPFDAFTDVHCPPEGEARV